MINPRARSAQVLWMAGQTHTFGFCRRWQESGRKTQPVVPAQAGIQWASCFFHYNEAFFDWIPAFAGMTRAWIRKYAFALLWMGDLIVPVLIVFGACAISSVFQPVKAEADAAPISVIRTEAAEDMDDRVNSAYRAYQAGDLVAAKSGYADVLQAYPDNRNAMLGLAACAVREGDTRSAVSMYQRIIRAFPQDALSRAALVGLQQNRQGEPLIRQLLARQADNPFLYASLGQLLAAQTRWPEARQAFSAAHRIDPANPVYTLNLAISLDRMGHREEALNYYRTTLKLVESGASDLDIRPVIRRLHSLR